MKKIVVIIVILQISMEGFAQTTHAPDSIRGNAYKTFIGRILGTNGMALAPSFSLNLTPPSPAVSGTIPLYPCTGSFKAYNPKNGVYDPYRGKRFFLAATANLAAQNGYTTITKGGTLQSNWSVGAATTFILNRRVNFYSAEVNNTLLQTDNNPYHLTYIAPIDRMPITQASSVFFTWINITAGYAQNNVPLYRAFPPDSGAVNQHKEQGVSASANFNLYYFPSRQHCPWFSIYGQIGVSFIQKTNNVDTLTVDNVTTTSYTNVSPGNIITHSNTTAAYDSSSFKEGYAVSFPIQCIFLFSSVDHTFYIGLGLYDNISVPQYHSQQPDVFNLKPSDDIGFTINLPITTAGGTNTAANLSLQCIWKDVGAANSYYGEVPSTYRKQNFNVGFSVTVPLLILHSRPPDANGN